MGLTVRVDLCRQSLQLIHSMVSSQGFFEFLLWKAAVLSVYCFSLRENSLPPVWDLISLPDSRRGLDFQCVQLWTDLLLGWCGDSPSSSCPGTMEKSDRFLKHTRGQFLRQICQSQNLPRSYRCSISASPSCV